LAFGTLRWYGLRGLLMASIVLSMSSRALSQSGVGSREKSTNGQSGIRSGAAATGAETPEVGVDLRPVFQDLGLATRAQGNRGAQGTNAWSAPATVRYVQFRVEGELRSGVTPGSARARQVLKALRLSDLRPLTPPPGKETTM